MVLSLSTGAALAPARSLVIAAGGGRDLAWSQQRVVAALVARSGGRKVHLLLHGGARGADTAIAMAAHQLSWPSVALPAQWQRHGQAAGPIRNRALLELAVARAKAHSRPDCPASVLVVAFPGGAGTASLVYQARRMAPSSPVPIAVVELSPSTTHAHMPAAAS